MAGLGWSVGDIIAAMKIVKQLVDGFNDAKGAQAQFKESYMFLKALHSNLEMIVKYKEHSSNDPYLDVLDQHIEVIRTACTNFTTFLRKHLHLHPTSTSRVRKAWDTVKWTMVNGEVEKLRAQLSDTLLTLELWLEFETSVKIDRFSDRVEGNFERVERQMHQNLAIILALHKQWESLAGEAASQWREDATRQHDQVQDNLTGLDKKVEEHGKALTQMHEHNDVFIQRMEAMMDAVENGYLARQSDANAEVPELQAKREEKIQTQKHVLMKLKRSSRDAAHFVNVTVRDIKQSDKSINSVGPLITHLEQTLKAISVSSWVARILHELARVGRRIERTGKETSETIRDHAISTSKGFQTKADAIFRRSPISEASNARKQDDVRNVDEQRRRAGSSPDFASAPERAPLTLPATPWITTTWSRARGHLQRGFPTTAGQRPISPRSATTGGSSPSPPSTGGADGNATIPRVALPGLEQAITLHAAQRSDGARSRTGSATSLRPMSPAPRVSADDRRIVEAEDSTSLAPSNTSRTLRSSIDRPQAIHASRSVSPARSFSSQRSDRLPPMPVPKPTHLRSASSLAGLTSVEV